MPHHYSTLKAQIETDIKAVMGNDCRISFGRIRKPLKTTKYGIVMTTVTRQNVVRQVRETYQFAIALQIPLPDPEASDIESALMDLADDLVMLLAPYDADDVPASAGQYAGVGNLRHVTKVEPLEIKDTDSHVTVVIDFSCECRVYQ